MGKLSLIFFFFLATVQYDLATAQHASTDIHYNSTSDQYDFATDQTVDFLDFVKGSGEEYQFRKNHDNHNTNTYFDCLPLSKRGEGIIIVGNYVNPVEFQVSIFLKEKYFSFVLDKRNIKKACQQAKVDLNLKKI